MKLKPMKIRLEPGVLPKRPYRDSALLYGAFAVVFVVIVWATNGAVLPRFHPRTDGWPHFVVGALPIAVACFVIATGYSWWRIRQQLEAEDRNS
jgi:hypothetical protein